ncbi:MAG: hypothetical protein WCT52_02635 [Candidatus Micrarchaeia archaeon]
MQHLLRQIERRYFNGDTLKGERQRYIFRELARRGCEPKIDSHGNIWTMKGSGKPLALFSSHMDVDPRISRHDLKHSKVGGGRVASGVLDNAVGCTLNILLAQRAPKKGCAIHVFTASEEIAAKNPRVFARSARVVARTLKRLGLAPAMCVTIDVTYPELLAPHHKTDWSKTDDELFCMMDKTDCYVDGYLDRRSKRLGAALVRKFGDKNVRVRNLPGHDETVAYGKLAPSFAFGPVVFGSFDRPGQTMPMTHMKTALRFLKFVAGQNGRKR